MRPVQVRLPSLIESSWLPEVQRDRAYSARCGADVVWLFPGARGIRKWRTGAVRMLGVGEHPPDRSDVFHVDGNGYVWGPGCSNRFKSESPHGFLDKRLSTDPSELVLAPEQLRARLTDPDSEALTPGPTGAIPVVAAVVDHGSLAHRWPPSGREVPMVPPPQESRDAPCRFCEPGVSWDLRGRCRWRSWARGSRSV